MQQSIQVTPNGRFLQRADGAPFFYLGDTAWQLFHRLTLAESTHYLTNRAAKGFTVIQAVALAELGRLYVPNANGDLPLLGCDQSNAKDGIGVAEQGYGWAKWGWAALLSAASRLPMARSRLGWCSPSVEPGPSTGQPAPGSPRVSNI